MIIWHHLYCLPSVLIKSEQQNIILEEKGTKSNINNNINILIIIIFWAEEIISKNEAGEAEESSEGIRWNKLGVI